jgi:16S rRNA (cytidine1402-2'-O)-methyltransferase
LIWLETPHRLSAALEDLLAVLGDRQLAVAGELTKMYEDIFRGSISQAKTYFAEQPARGEYTLVVAGQSETREKWTETQLDAALVHELGTGAPLSQIAKEIARQSGWPRRQVYQRLTELQADKGEKD